MLFTVGNKNLTNYNFVIVLIGVGPDFRDFKMWGLCDSELMKYSHIYQCLLYLG
jgi:hypothetical protein